MKYLLAAGIIVVLVLLIALVSFRMDSHKVPVEPELPQPKAAVSVSEPRTGPSKSKPTESEPQAALPVVDERPTPSPRGGGKRSAAKVVKQVGPAPVSAPAAQSSERPVPKLSGRSGVEDSRPNPFAETQEVSQSQISAVVRNKANQAALKSCYERALKMDNHLTSGRIDVTVSIGTVGHGAAGGRQRARRASSWSSRASRARSSAGSSRQAPRNTRPISRSLCRAGCSARPCRSRAATLSPMTRLPHRHPYAAFLSEVEKPSRYVGGEYGERARISAAARRASAWPSPTSTTSGCRTSGRRSSTAPQQGRRASPASASSRRGSTWRRSCARAGCRW